MQVYIMSFSYFRQISTLLFCIVIGLNGYALNTGDQLADLHIKTDANEFNYHANGKHQLILIYSLELSSRKIKQFHHKIMAKGFCPQSIVDMNKRAWYAPLSVAESELRSEVKNSPNPKCAVIPDYNNAVSKQWRVESRPSAIVVNGQGRVVFLAEGTLTEQQQQTILQTLQQDLTTSVATNP